MAFIVRQDEALSKSTGLNIAFTPESFETFSREGNTEHLRNFFGQQGWHRRSPLEIHPYLDKYPAKFERKNLLIGTMPPISYLRHPEHHTKINKRGLGNAPLLYYFYGNKGPCWHYFIDSKINKTEEIEKFLSENSMTISDTVKMCQRKVNTDYNPNNELSKAYTADDKDLYNVLLNEELGHQLLSTDCQIKNLYFTSGGVDDISFDKLGKIALSGTKFSAFSSFVATLFLMNTSIELAVCEADQGSWHLLHYNNKKFVQNIFDGKVIFKIRLGQKSEFKVICLPSPASRNPLGQIFFKKWLYYYSPLAYGKYLKHIDSFTDKRKVSSKSDEINNLNKEYNFLPKYVGFTNPGDIYLRDIYQLSLRPEGLRKLADIQNQII